MCHEGTTLTLHDGSPLVFPYNRDMNLPLMLPYKKPQAMHCLTKLDLSALSDLLGTVSPSHSTVADETNQNITCAQKELLLWHWQFGHCGFQWVQFLAAMPRSNDNGTRDLKYDRVLLPTKNVGVSSCATPLCAACQLAKQSRRGADVSFELKDRQNTCYSVVMTYSLAIKYQLTSSHLLLEDGSLILKVTRNVIVSTMVEPSLLITLPGSSTWNVKSR
jgi:hypothetical protein